MICTHLLHTHKAYIIISDSQLHINMETKSIQFQDPHLQHSFSFTTITDFDNHPIDDTDDDESYFEIALEPTHLRRHEDDAGGGECSDDEMELRISFSSTFQFPEETKTMELYESVDFCKSSVSSLSSSSLSTFTFSSTPTGSQLNQEKEVKPKTEKSFKSKVQFPSVNRLVSTFVSSLKVPGIDLANGHSVATSQLELLPPTSNDRTATAISNGMMMKFLIKFRALKLGTLLASFIKVSQGNSGESKEKKGQAKSNNLLGNGNKASKVLELNLDGIRGTLESMIGRKDRTPKTDSSPLVTQTYKMCANDNSIQAAIAHCNKSFHP